MGRNIHIWKLANNRHALNGVIVLLTAMIACQPLSMVEARSAASSVDLPPMSLTVVGLNGTQIVLNSTDIGNLSLQRGKGGWKNSIGTIRGPYNYTGVSILTLCNLVGGLDNNTTVRVTASDNYNKTLNYYQVAEGDFITYDPTTGDPVVHNQTLTPIAAYFKDDLNLTVDEGPLRLAIIGSENVVTDSKYWVKFVVKLEIIWGHDVAVLTIAPTKSIVGQGYACKVNLTILNRGGYSETFDVTLYMNGTQVQSQSVTLTSENSAALPLVWNTTAFAKGNYNVSSFVGPVFGEVELDDNLLMNGSIYVGLVGDINADGKVNMQDIGVVARHFSEAVPPADPNWDIFEDWKIDMRDIGILGRHFGEIDL